MANEKNHAYTSTPVLSKVKIGGAYYYLKDAEARSVIDSILNDYLTSTDKAALQALIDAKVSTTVYEAKVEQLIAADNALGKRITDELAAEANTRKTEDDKLSARITAIENAEIGVKSGENVISLNSSTHELSTTLGLKLENRDDGKEYLVLTGINGAKVADIDATRFLKDGMINDVKLTTEGKNKYLVITFNTDSGKTEPIKLDVSSLIDVYTAGDGLTLTDRKFSVNKDSTSEEYLVVSSSGIKITGIDSAINTAKQAAEDYADEKVSAEATRAQGVEDGLKTRLTAAEGEITTLKGKPAAGITSDQISKWDNEVGAKEAVAAEKSRAEGAEKAINDKIGTSADATTASTVYGAINKEIADRTKGDADTLQSAKSYADNAVSPKADKSYVDEELAKKVDKVTGKSLIADTEITRLAGIETGAQVNVIEHIKLNGKEVTAGENKTVDLGTIATSEQLSALAGRVTTAEGDIDTLESKMATVQGDASTVGSFAKGDAETLQSAKDYVDNKAIEESGAHTHTVTASGKITPNLSKTEKFLSATASGTAVETTASDQFVKSVTLNTKNLVTAEYVSGVAANSTTINGVTATVGTDGEDAECLIFTEQSSTFNALGDVVKTKAATGAVETNGAGAAVGISVDATQKGTAIGSVSIKTQPTITLSNTGNTGVKFVETVSGAETSVSVEGTAASSGAHIHTIGISTKASE